MYILSNFCSLLSKPLIIQINSLTQFSFINHRIIAKQQKNIDKHKIKLYTVDS